ncbi:ZYRO0G05346p [Zygosaccharomyces rouxii]|uniref:ZYRO0G05346p n=1 Tax=Zygosaccharomyces rouxii (strain ATCC 2623 / CBS 732 / NBRC 1130 / NCYC 568 / NRRL Y-229) TaxID=559307 RepID=C5DZL2_ZYGRC|nr:uncharacterized protein ZYRO0G05346g [Zygosaccharomyces rouxii]KAH9202295.1 pyridoxal phosphate-dependent transferase [Zygosaccharomyces rouxii]CAR29296.1 ZYRO0G05346p [Zygosaccharomyces rouxii]
MTQFDFGTLKSRYTSFLSRRDAAKELVKFWDNPPGPGVIELAGGMPNAGFFPIDSIDLHVVSHPFEKNHGKNGLKVHMDKQEPKDMPLSMSLQYTNTEGMGPLVSFAKKMIERINPPAYGGWNVCMANGSSDAMYKVFEVLCDEDSTVMLEEFTFSPVISNIKLQGASVVPVKMQLSADPEQQGIDVDRLADLLDNWSVGPYKHLNKPKALYTVATGQNPTGMTLSPTKRRRIYEIAQKHDFLIVEDDPYGYLFFPPYNPKEPMNNAYWDDKSLTVQKYVDDYLVKSFLTIDTDARVIRLETFSKLYAPGLRLSFVVANEFLIERIFNMSEVTTRAPSGVSQALVYGVVKEMGKKYSSESEPSLDSMVTGWMEWPMKVAGYYTHRRNVAFKALYETEGYSKGLYQVMEPSAGMFIDLKPCWPQNELSRPDHYDLIIEKMDKLNQTLLKTGVQVVLGYRMAVDVKASKDTCDFVRITIAYANDDQQIVEACHRIGKGFEAYFSHI